MKNPIKTLEPNTQGRDFVIGDLHGSYSVFENLLANINFNPETDRMISVGDLVDRGPDSMSCLELLRKPWFHAVLSNHEQMMIEKFNGGYMGQWWYQNGGHWGMEAYNDYKAIHKDHTRNIPMSPITNDLLDLLPVVEELPFLITVNIPGGKKFHVVHAEFPFWGAGVITDEKLTDPDYVMDLATTHSGDGDSFLWSRYIFSSFYRSNLEEKDRERAIRAAMHCRAHEHFTDKLSHVISGHTIVRQPITLVGQTNIDTGAYYSYWVPQDPYATGGRAPEPWAGLTCVELGTWKFYKATPTDFEEITPYVISKEDISVLQASQ